METSFEKSGDVQVSAPSAKLLREGASRDDEPEVLATSFARFRSAGVE